MVNQINSKRNEMLEEFCEKMEKLEIRKNKTDKGNKLKKKHQN